MRAAVALLPCLNLDRVFVASIGINIVRVELLSTVMLCEEASQRRVAGEALAPSSVKVCCGAELLMVHVNGRVTVVSAAMTNVTDISLHALDADRENGVVVAVAELAMLSEVAFKAAVIATSLSLVYPPPALTVQATLHPEFRKPISKPVCDGV